MFSSFFYIRQPGKSLSNRKSPDLEMFILAIRLLNFFYSPSIGNLGFFEAEFEGVPSPECPSLTILRPKLNLANETVCLCKDNSLEQWTGPRTTSQSIRIIQFGYSDYRQGFRKVATYRFAPQIWMANLGFEIFEKFLNLCEGNRLVLQSFTKLPLNCL